MKVALISTTWSIPKGYDDRIRVPYPIGLIELAAVLEQHNIEVMLIDALGEGWNQKKVIGDNTIIGLDDTDIIEKLKNFKPDYIGIGSLFTSQRDNVIRLAKSIKKNLKDVKLIVGGVDATICSNELTKYFDYIIQGEADKSLLNLILHGSNTKIIKSDIIKDLNILPMPAYHLLNFQNYFDAGEAGLSSRGITINKWMSIFTSRGCPYHCNFCSINLISSRKWRGKDPKKVLDEIECLNKKYGINYFFIEDDNMTLDVKRAEEIFDGIVKRKLKISFEFPNGIRADTMTKRLAKKLKKAGCKKVIFGIENGNQEFLKNVIHKNLDLNKVISATKICYKEGIQVGGFFIIGIPGENLNIMLSSIWFAMKLASHGMAPGFTLATPLPKTEMFEDALKKGYIIKKKITPTDYLKSYSEPLMTTPNFTYKQLIWWKKIATLLCIITLFITHPNELSKTNTWQEIKKNPNSIFKKIGAVLRGST